MAKVVITIIDSRGGVSVQCRVEEGEKDSERVRSVAKAVGAGLAGIVNERVRKALNKTRKGNNHVH